MIIEGLLKALFFVLKGLLSTLPVISWDIDKSVFGTFLDIVQSICYLLPMGTISIIISLTVSFIIFKSVISLIKTIWAMLPLV